MLRFLSAHAVLAAFLSGGTIAAVAAPIVWQYLVLRRASRTAAAGVGRQVILDLYQCGSGRLDDLEWVRSTMMEAAQRARATIVTTAFHQFSPWGISGVVVISQSHLAIHIWPELNFAAVDIFTCSAELGLKAAADYLVSAFESRQSQYIEVPRGSAPDPRAALPPLIPAEFHHSA